MAWATQSPFKYGSVPSASFSSDDPNNWADSPRTGQAANGGGSGSGHKDESSTLRTWRYITIILALAVLSGFGFVIWNKPSITKQADVATTVASTSSNQPPFLHDDSLSNIHSLPMPDGVNIGSWLSLEDYFFSGQYSSIEVATPDGYDEGGNQHTSGICLPPLHTTTFSTGPTWNSETDLLQNLAYDTTLGHALRVFHAHRNSYVDFEYDLDVLSKLGITSIRVPLSWCLTDENPELINEKDTSKLYTQYLRDHYTCQDPYFEDVIWPAIPRSLIVNLLKACSKHGIKATLDMHTYPGGTSPGTFSGVWPKWPRFWSHGDLPASNGEEDIGRDLWKNFVAWIESLDDDTLNGLGALSPMNEPGHLAGVFMYGRDIGSQHFDPYLPPLSREQAQEYLQKLRATPYPKTTRRRGGEPAYYTVVPDGPHLRVLKWLDDAVDVFRTSSLPKRNIELAVNVHESVFNAQIVPGDDENDPGGRHPGSMYLIGAWWRSATTVDERSSWAVLDVHHYHSWEPQCQGASDGHLIGNYTCSNIQERNDALQRCTSWATVFRQAINHECGVGSGKNNGGNGHAKLMSGEMSASTHHKVRHACNDISTLKASYVAQLQAAKAANVKLYYWSYKMPYGGAFKPAWSFKHFLYLMGVLSHPDETNYPCTSDHKPIPGEPNDDIFD